MLIGKNYKIETDELNVTISSKSVARTGKMAGQEIWTAEGYFSTFKAALNWLVDHEVKNTELRDLMTVVSKQDELHALINNLEVN